MIDKRFGFDQYGKNNVRENLYFGCYGNCRYCGVRRSQCLWLKRRPNNKWNLMEFKRDEYKKGVGERKGLTIFPSGHDVFPFNKMVSFRYMEKIIHPKEDIYNKLMFISKPRMSVIEPFVKRFSKYKDHILLRFTITTQNEDLINFWEGNSSSFSEREKSLIYCFTHGFETSISIEPYLGSPNDVINLVDTLNPFVSETIWIGHMNRIATKKWLKKNNKSKKAIKEYNKIRENCKKKSLIKIIKGLKNYKMIRYKESFLKNDSLCSIIPSYQIPKLKKA